MIRFCSRLRLDSVPALLAERDRRRSHFFHFSHESTEKKTFAQTHPPNANTNLAFASSQLRWQRLPNERSQLAPKSTHHHYSTLEGTPKLIRLKCPPLATLSSSPEALAQAGRSSDTTKAAGGCGFRKFGLRCFGRGSSPNARDWN